MAHPEHEEVLDPFDELTVTLYRLGHAVSAIFLMVGAGISHTRGTLDPWLWWPVTVGVVMCASSVHLYDKRIRWLAAAFAWDGLLVLAAVPVMPSEWQWWATHLGFGLVTVCLSAFAIKEQFCFKIPGLRAIPLFLAGSLVASSVGEFGLAALGFALSGAIQGMLAVAKMRQPLHFDIGDRRMYQV